MKGFAPGFVTLCCYHSGKLLHNILAVFVYYMLLRICFLNIF